jgi:hypothetical protein
MDRQADIKCFFIVQCLQKLEKVCLLALLKFYTYLFEMQQKYPASTDKKMLTWSCCTAAGMGQCPYVKQTVVKTHRVEFLIVNKNDAYFCLSGAVDLTLAGRMKEITHVPT